MTTSRDELRHLVDELPESQLERAIGDVRRLMTNARQSPRPPAWFGMADGTSTDTARRARELLSDGFGRS